MFWISFRFCDNTDFNTKREGTDWREEDYSYYILINGCIIHIRLQEKDG